MDWEPAKLENLWFVIIFGMIPVFLYLIVRIGLIKSWYILRPLPGLLSGKMVYGALAWGLGFVAMALVGTLPARNIDAGSWRLFFVLMSFGVLGFFLTIWQPPWLKPRWVRWLEYEYGYCLDILIAEARQMGRWAWEEQVRTRSGMERWAQDVVARHKKEIDERWEKEREYRLADKMTDALGRGRIELEDYVMPDIPQHRREQEENRLKEIAERQRRIRRQE